MAIDEFQINLGDIRFIQPLLRELGDEEGERAGEAIDRKDRASLAEIAGSGNVNASTAMALEQLPDLIGRAEVLARAATLASEGESRAALDRLGQIDSLLTPAERDRVVYDLGEIRGLGYYSGIRFEVFIAGVGRAVGSGGRYDGLLALYGREAAAVGFALETDAIADLLVSRER